MYGFRWEFDGLMASKKNTKGKENDEEEKIIKKVVSAYKYSAKG